MIAEYVGGRDHKHYIEFTGITERRVEFSYRIGWRATPVDEMRRALGLCNIEPTFYELLESCDIPTWARVELRQPFPCRTGVDHKAVTVSFAARPRQDRKPISGALLWKSIPLTVGRLGQMVQLACVRSMLEVTRPVYQIYPERPAIAIAG